MKDQIANALDGARGRSLALLDPLPDELQVKQHSPLMSPLVWDLAHVGNYEDLWLLRAVGGVPGVGPQYDDIYDAFKHVRRDRPRLALLGPAEARAYIADVRNRSLDLLDQVEFDPANPMLDQGFVYGMVIQHEQQHDETMLATIQLMDADGPRPAGMPTPRGAPIEVSEVAIPGGTFVMGTDIDPWAYDNERPAHEVELAPYFIDTAPVTNDAYKQFVAGGGYDDSRHWSEAGWAWRLEEGLEHPQFWERNGTGWVRVRFGALEPIEATEPVQHVCWYEAEAFCNWAGRRLPTEAEWEFAASWAPTGRKLRYPWGDTEPASENANIGQRHMRPAPVGAYPKGVSPWGCHQMIGDVWEWTSSDFNPYPGFKSFPYAEYSEVFFGHDYKVLRGGSWATHPLAIRATFRNWDFPIRRQIFSGFRTARDA